MTIKKETRDRKRLYQSNAERQRIYRERIKANRYTAITTVGKSSSKGLELTTSGISDLSKVRKW